MTLEMEHQTFRGVVCLNCKAPIPVPAIVGEFSVVPVEGKLERGRSSVFNVRCACCHKERPYRTSEILSFDGLPLPIAPFAPPSGARPNPLSELSRGAKA